MFSKVRTALAVGLAIAATAPSAYALDLQAGGAPKPRPTKAQLGILCPGPALLRFWVFSNVPGTFNVMVVRDNGDAKGPYPVTTVAGAGGVVVGQYNIPLVINQPTNIKYRVAVANSNVGSNWVALTGC